MPRIEYIGLEFENAYIYRRCAIPLANQGLVLIRGLNLDDGGYLGAGKSSIFEMFAQTQIGKGGKLDPRRGDHRSDIVNMFAGGDLHSMLHLRVDGEEYKIHQYRNHHRWGNQVHVERLRTGESNIVPRSAVRAPHKWIREELLKIDETTFFNLIYLVQELNNVMIHGKESDRRKRLTVMFNLDVYDALQSSAKRTLALHETSLADINEVKTELEDVEQRLEEMPDQDLVEERLELAEEKLTQLQQEHDQDTEEFTQLSELAGRLKLRDEIRNRVLRRFRLSPLKDRFQSPTAVTEAKVQEWGTEYQNANAELVSVSNDIDRLEKKSILEGQLRLLDGRPVDEIQEELATVKSRLTYLSNIELRQAEERAELLQELQRAGASTRDAAAIDEELQSTRQNESTVQNRISVLAEQVHTAVCPTCKRPFDNLSVEEITAMQQELQEKRSVIEELSSHVIRLQAELKGAKARVRIQLRMKALETERTPEEVMQDIRQLSGQERRLTAEMDTSQKKLQIEAELATMPQENEDGLAERQAVLTRKAQRLQELYEAAKYVYDKLIELSGLPEGDQETTEADARKVRKRMRGSSAAISEASSNATTLRDNVDIIRRLKRRRSTLMKTIRRRDSIVQEAEALRALVKAFGPSGLKQDRFHAIISDAAQRTVPAYADILWPNRNIELSLSDTQGSLQLEMTRTDAGIATGSSMLSGGERHKSGLAFLFGMRDLKELYTGSSANILVVDEPFGNMDPLGTEGLVSIFSMLKQKFSSVFVISHRPEVLSHPIWDQTWWAVRHQNNATLYRDNLPAEYQQIAAELVKQ
jgi:DNA repair exonuclease SbcCD ATPase subunit